MWPQIVITIFWFVKSFICSFFTAAESGSQSTTRALAEAERRHAEAVQQVRVETQAKMNSANNAHKEALKAAVRYCT